MPSAAEKRADFIMLVLGVVQEVPNYEPKPNDVIHYPDGVAPPLLSQTNARKKKQN